MLKFLGVNSSSMTLTQLYVIKIYCQKKEMKRVFPCYGNKPETRPHLMHSCTNSSVPLLPISFRFEDSSTCFRFSQAGNAKNYPGTTAA